MSNICNDPISDHEILGRTITETSYINKKGKIKDKLLYPRLREDQEPARKGLLTNKISVVRICRAQEADEVDWQPHISVAESFLNGSSNVFRGFGLMPSVDVRSHGLTIVPDAHEKNPYHAHIIIPEYDVKFDESIHRDTTLKIQDIMPVKYVVALDRLRLAMIEKGIAILKPCDRYDKSYPEYPTPCDACRNL